jgi:hypothetical protein
MFLQVGFAAKGAESETKFSDINLTEKVAHKNALQPVVVKLSRPHGTLLLDIHQYIRHPPYGSLHLTPLSQSRAQSMLIRRLMGLGASQ